LLVAWIAAQLQWTAKSRSEREIRFQGSAGVEISVEFQETEGAPISSCVFETGDVSIAVHREAGSMHHKAEVRLADGRVYHHVLPAGSDDLCDLLDEELTRGGKHRVYLKALRSLRQIFQA
jgi:hypothetical protein